MATRLAAQAEVVVDATPEEAFRIFSEDIGFWWRRNTPYWNDRERGLFLRIEPGVGGRFLEVYDADAGTGFELGRVTVWEPGERLGLTWTQASWPDGVFTDIEINFEPAAEGTLVRLEHTGFERVGREAETSRDRYDGGWKTVLGWFAERANASPA
jgi:activator of HSP90 ATPase